jgi:hypothetical protein
VWKRWLVVVVVVVGGAATWWVLAHRRSDRALIDELIAKAEHGVETKSVDEIMGCVAEDYHDELGFNRTDIWRLAQHWIRTPDEADVVVEDYSVDIQPPRATGQLAVNVMMTRDGRQMPPLPLELTVRFEKERRGWRRVWLVESVTGQNLGRVFEDVM